MKNTRRVASLLLALVMVFALAVTAFAAEIPTTGTITIDPANEGQTYTLYKLFDVDENGNYLQPEDNQYILSSKKNLFFEKNEAGYVVTKADFDPTMIGSYAFKDWATSYGKQVGEPVTAGADGKVVFENVPYGYYYVKSTLGSALSVTTINPNAVVADKNNPPEMTKLITAINGVEIDPAETATVQIGDVVTYTVTIIAKPGAQGFKFTDELSAGLYFDTSIPNSEAIVVSPETYTHEDGRSLPTVQSRGRTHSATKDTLTVQFAAGFLNRITEDTEITIVYQAVVSEDAVIGAAGNPNTAKLEYGSSDPKDYIEAYATVYTAQIVVDKYDGADDAKLAGVKFVLQNAEGKYYKVKLGDKTAQIPKDNAVIWVDTLEEADVLVTDENGYLAFTGLGNGTYTLVETEALAGYTKASDQEITINNKTNTDDELILTAKVENNTGSTLPSTGGMGTTLFYTVGGFLVLAAVVLLVTKRRMGVAE